mmetsp:Transcript_130102/g.324349  ORF Transcript_130102/g.324349 Transcript_130102/m.324349 type:complete len:374 (+) Transcript_130102:114-1235(+)
MGIPSSPHFGLSPCVAQALSAAKHAATPELPLLQEAASELASLEGFQLLPASVLERSESTTTPTTALPASPHEEDSEASSPADDVLLEALAPQAEPAIPKQEDEEVRDEPTRSRFVSMAPVAALVDPAGGYVPMWCTIRNLEEGNMLIIPCADGSSNEMPDPRAIPDDSRLVKLWCWAQPNGQGGMMVVPCTGKEAEVRAEDAPAAESACAPVPPTSDTCIGMPQWPEGPYYPLNAAPTTLSISCLPKDLTQEELLEVLDREEFSGFYDFVFLPEKSEPCQSERHALINLVRHEYALTLASRLQGRTFWGVGDRTRSCEVTWSQPVQGLEALIQVYRDAPENHANVEEHLRPQLFSKGWPVPMPPPTAPVALC